MRTSLQWYKVGMPQATSWREHKRANSRKIQTPPKGAPRNFACGTYNWPFDFAVTRNKNGGQACKNHHRCCQSVARHLYPEINQCMQWAMKGRTYCKFHGGKLRYKANRMGSYYRNRGGKFLGKLLDDVQKGTPEDQLSLLDELSVARVMTGQVIEKWEFTHTGKTKDGEPASDLAKNLASEAVRSSVKYVCDIAEKAAKVRAHSEDTIRGEHIEYFLKSVAHVLEKELPRDEALRVMEAIRCVKMPNVTGKESSAAQKAQEIRTTVAAMDATVPPPDGTPKEEVA